MAFLTGCQCRRSAAPDAGRVSSAPAPRIEPPPPVDGEGQLARRLDRALTPSSSDAERAFAERGVGAPTDSQGLAWDCTRFGDDAAVCMTERALVTVDPVEGIEPGNGHGTFTHVRLVRRVEGALRGADWPAPSAALFSHRESAGGDCMAQCDEGGFPLEGAQPDEPAGVGTGACYASCHRGLTDSLEGTYTVDTKLELVGVLGADRYVFQRVVTRSFNPGPQPEPAQEDGEEVAEEPESDSTSTDYLVLEHPGDRPLTAAGETVFIELEHPRSSVWVLDARVFVSLEDGGVLEGDEACGTEEAQQVSACDGGTP
ncbi:MAG: hypothetical protein Q8L48_37555 [Archangium sp.]|nr:hypothetical protein [Archangium sp.]